MLNHFAKHQQNTESSYEAGGQLFARFVGNQVRIEKATGPRPADRRSRFLFIPDRRQEQQEIDEMHRKGLHFVGDWHTHPQPTASPSYSDLRSIKDVFSRSKHNLNGFVMIIVGSDDFPAALHISLHSATAECRLVPEER